MRWNNTKRVMITDTKGNYLKWATRAGKQYSQLKFERIFCWQSSYDDFKKANNDKVVFFDLCFSGSEDIVQQCFQDLRENLATIV